MKKKLLNSVFFIFLVSASLAQTVFENYIDGRVYVKFTKTVLKSVSREDPRNVPLAGLKFLDPLISKYGITKASFPFHQASDDANLPYILKLEFSKIGQVNALIGELRTIPGAEYAEKVSLMKVNTTTPNDFALSTASVHLTQINAQNAWDYFNGNSNITVAITDNAVMWSHADLIANTYTNIAEASGVTGVDDDGNGYIDDIHGYNVSDNDNNAEPFNTSIHFHGTLCAGVAGARTNNGIGVSSIGWNLKIIPVQCESDASGSPVNVSNGYEGIIYAARSGARIISCSWGNQTAYSHTDQYAVDYAWNRGSIIIASAGNFGNSIPTYPGAYNHVYCVAAVDPSDVAWSGSCFGSWVDVSAPGTSIYSTMAYVGTPTYASFSGTSFAAPMVAGLAGLMLSKSPNMTRTDVLNCISSTAANIYTLAGNSGYVAGNKLGAGRIDAFAAMVCASTYSALPPVANFYAFLPNTCPNTLIPFKDSSLYQPTSWSWTFQGGSPATSTSSNPSVQWSTPGTYFVSLTVTNANGFNTKTKLSYITVSGPSPLPFSEGFQSATFLPANWTPNNLWNDSIYWQRVTGIGGYGSSTACAMFDNFVYNAPGERDEMRSPKFDFSNVASARLRFDVAYARYNPTLSDTLQVKVSTDCGTSWTSIYLKGGTNLATAPDQGSRFVPGNAQWRTESIDISGLTAGQGNVMFSFLNRGGFGQPIYLDNINLAFPTPTLATINVPSVCITPTYTFSNISQAAASYTWNFQGGSPPSSTASNPAVSYATPGTYTFSLAGTNGTATAAITKTITVVAQPTVSASSGSYCSGNSSTLNANAIGANSFIWSDAQGVIGTSSVLVFTPLSSSFFTLVASNAACSAEAVFTINVISSPTVSVSGQSICSGSQATLTASGATTYSWHSPASSNNFIVVSPGFSTDYTVTGISGSCSDTKTVSVTVFPVPVSAISTTNASCGGCPDGILSANASGGTAPYTYTWLPSGGNADIATGLVPNCYTVTIADINSCMTQTSACVGISTGLKEFSVSNALMIYPNPAKQSVNIELKGRLFNCAVYNGLGQMLGNKQACHDLVQLNLNEFAKGIYLIEVESGGEKVFKKLVVE